jgi:hypothetical protein
MGQRHELIDYLATVGLPLVNAYKRIPRVSWGSPDFSYCVPHLLEAQPPMFFSLHSDRIPEKAKVAPQPRRQSTTISMMEEEFGMREPPQAVTRFGGNGRQPSPSLLLMSFPFLQVCRPGSGSFLRSASSLSHKLRSHVESSLF